MLILYEFVKSLSHFFVPKKTTASFTREPLTDNRKGCPYGMIYNSIRAKHQLLFTLHFSLFSARQGFCHRPTVWYIKLNSFFRPIFEGAVIFCITKND